MDFRFFLCDFYVVQVSMQASRFQDVLLHPHYMDPAEATSEGKCGTERQTFNFFPVRSYDGKLTTYIWICGYKGTFGIRQNLEASHFST